MPDPDDDTTEHWRALLVDDADCCELLARLKEEYNTQHDEIERLRARITELEAALAVTLGSLAQPTPTADDEPPMTRPSAPPHGDQPPIGHTIVWPPSIKQHE